MKEACAWSCPHLINLFFVFSSIMLPTAGTFLWQISSFIAWYFSTSTAFEICEWTLLSFEQVKIWIAGYLVALVEQWHKTVMPATFCRASTQMTASSASPSTNPMPEASRLAPTAPALIYRVAQNKIPHQTICNIFATSGQILKILEAV